MCCQAPTYCCSSEAEVNALHTVFSCVGTIPSSWADVGAFPSLHKLLMNALPITGSLPATWGSSAFPMLTELNLQRLTKLTGSLPAEWASTTSFQQLELLMLYNCSVTGSYLALDMHLHTRVPAENCHPVAVVFERHSCTAELA